MSMSTKSCSHSRVARGADCRSAPCRRRARDAQHAQNSGEKAGYAQGADAQLKDDGSGARRRQHRGVNGCSANGRRNKQATKNKDEQNWIRTRSMRAPCSALSPQARKGGTAGEKWNIQATSIPTRKGFRQKIPETALGGFPIGVVGSATCGFLEDSPMTFVDPNPG